MTNSEFLEELIKKNFEYILQIHLAFWSQHNIIYNQ